jgi:SAM-dependent methyltransferase
MSGTDRLNPPLWDHQAYSLVRLRDAIRSVLDMDGVAVAGATVVDVGAGDAPYRRLFEARGCRYVACDIDGAPDVRIEPGRPLPLEDGVADGVVSFQVLEHVWDVDGYLTECRRILKPGGWLLLSTHGVWLYHPHPTDYRRWTRDGLAEELRVRRFRVQAIHALVGPLAWMTNFYLLAAWDLLRRLPLAGKALFVPIGAVANLLMRLQDAITPRIVREDNAAIYLMLSRAET